MERGKRKTTTTPRKTPGANAPTSPDSVQNARLKMGRLRSVRSGTVTEKRKSENSDSGSEDTTLMKVTESCNNNSESSDGSQRRLYQATSSSRMKIASSNQNGGGHSPSVQVLKKSRSEPMQGGSSSGSELRKARSDNWGVDKKSDYGDLGESCDSDHVELSDEREDDSVRDEVLVNDSGENEEEIEEEIVEEVNDVVNGCETEVVVADSPKEEAVINATGDHVDSAIGDDNEGENNKIVDGVVMDVDDTCEDGRGGASGGSGGGGAGNESIQLNESKENKVVGDDAVDANTITKTCDDGGGGGGDGGCGNGDGLIPLNSTKKNKTNKMISARINKFNSGNLPRSTPTPNPATSPTKSWTSVSNSTPTSYKPITSRLNHKSNLKSSIPPTTERFENNNNSATAETHGKLQTLVDLVMWRDISRSAFIFGIGSFVIISSSYAKDFEFSLISIASYMSLVYLAVVFLYKSILYRRNVDKEDYPEMYVWGEEEALWLVKLILPYINELLLKLRGIFSGDPAMTMKLAVLLFVLARCGSSITLWKTVKLGFFGVFTVPKLCSSYSTHITAYGNFWVRRFQDAWESCSHKKAVAFFIFTLVWNYSSVIARTWAAFMLIVAFRYYQQSMITQEYVEEQQPASHNVHIRHIARNKCRVTTSLDQRKQKKSF